MPHPVGMKLPNELGLYDMSGNVDEWCADHWHETYAGAPNDGSPWLAGGNSNRRVVRGGSWDYTGSYCRVSVRFGDLPLSRYFNQGFRVAGY